jgi:hypothetical protein
MYGPSSRVACCFALLGARRLLAAGADPRATNSTGSTFQRYLARPSADLLTDAARRDQATIDDWLRAHGVPADTIAGARRP